MSNREYDVLRQLLLSADPYAALQQQRDTVFSLIPELAPSVGFVQNNPYHCRDLWDHTVYAVSQLPPDETLRLTMLLHDVGKLHCRTTDQNGIDHFYGHGRLSVKIAADCLPRLGICRSQAEEILSLIALHDVELERPAVRNKLYERFGEEFLLRLLLIQRADILAQNPEKLEGRIETLRQLRDRIVAAEENQ